MADQRRAARSWQRSRSTAIRRLSDGVLIDFAMTPDRRWLVTTGVGRTQLSDALNGNPIGPPLDEGAAVNLRVTITPRRILPALPESIMSLYNK